MHNRRLLFPFALFLAAIFALCGVSAMAATPFAITATSFTWSSAGPNASQYTVTGIQGDGTIQIGCVYAGTAMTKFPICGGGPLVQIPVTAGQTLTGLVGFKPWGTPIPASLQRTPHRSSYLPIAGLALAGVFMTGFGLRRGRWHWITMVVLAAGVLAGLAGISACGGVANPFAMMPGTYPYTITATWESSTPAILGAQTSTTVNVTVP